MPIRRLRRIRQAHGRRIRGTPHRQNGPPTRWHIELTAWKRSTDIWTGLWRPRAGRVCSSSASASGNMRWLRGLPTEFDGLPAVHGRHVHCLADADTILHAIANALWVARDPEYLQNHPSGP